MAISVTLLNHQTQGWNTSGSGQATTTVTTATVTPGANCHLVAILSVVGASTSTFTGVVPVSSGSGPSWTGSLVESVNASSGYNPVSAIWAVAIGGSDPGSFTVAVTYNTVSGGGDKSIHILSLYKVTGHDTGSPIGGKDVTQAAAGNGAVDATLDAAPATDDVTLAQCLVDENTTNKTSTFGAGTWTETANGSSSGKEMAYNTGYRTGSTSATVPWSDVNSGADNFGSTQAAVVVKAPVSGDITGTVAVTLASFTPSASGTYAGPPSTGYVKEVGVVTNTTAGTTSTITVAAGGVPVGDHVVVYGACDNTGTQGAATTITVTDTRSNTWSTQSPQAIADPGTAANGIQGFLVVAKITTALQAGDTITITYGNSTTAKAISAQQFTGVHQGTAVLASSYSTQDNQTGTTNSVSATPTVVGQAVCALIAVEGGTADSFTEDSDTTNGSWVTLTRRGSGTTAAGATLNHVYKIVTASGSQTYNPTLGTSRDHCAAILVLNVNHGGNIAVTLADFTSSASGSVSDPSGIAGSVAVTLEDFTSSASGTFTPAPITGTVAVTLASFTPTAIGVIQISGSVAQTLGEFVALGSQGSTALYPATISGRNLLDQNGDPIQLRCLSSWGLLQLNDNTAITARMEEAAARGFNCLAVVMDGSNDYGTGWERWQNAVSNKQFYATVDGGNTAGTPEVSPLGAAWYDHAAHMMDEADRLGLFILASQYIGFGTVGSNSALNSATTGQCQTTGQRWATFLSDWDNWILHVGADRPDAPDSKIEAFCQGVKDIRPGVIIVAEPDQNADTSEQWDPGDFTYFTPIEGLYYYGEDAVQAFDDTYSTDPSTGPVWDTEPGYIGANHYTTDISGAPNAAERQQLRERHYTIPLRDGVGLNNGHEDWWRFDAQGLFSAGDTAATAMDNTVVVQWQYGWTIWDLANTVDWAPSSTFVTTGVGTGDTKAAVGADGFTAIAYFPDSRTVVIDTTIITGTVPVRIRWFDPTDGTFTSVATSEAQQTGRSVTYPSAHADSQNDWVLVVQATDDRTGTSANTLASFTSSASGTVVANTGTVAQTLASFTSNASGTSTPPSFTGTASPTLGDFTSSASGSIIFTGTVAVTLGSFTSTASGTHTPPSFTGTVAQTLGDFTSDALGAFTPAGSGSGAVTLGDFTTSASGTFTPGSITGTVAVTLGSFTPSASGTFTPPPITGTAAVTLGDFTSTATGTSFPPGINGSVAVTLGDFTASASGTFTPPPITGFVAVTLASFTTLAFGSSTPPGFTGTAAILLNAVTMSATGLNLAPGEGVGMSTLDPFTMSASGLVALTNISGTVTVRLFSDEMEVRLLGSG